VEESGFFRSCEGSRFLVDVAKEVVERLVDLNVHVDSDVSFHGLEFHVDAATEKEGTSEDKKEAVHN
jgi:hypothetical protein